MRTLALTLAAALLAAAGCEKTIHEARGVERKPLDAPTAAEQRTVPAVDGVPIA